MVDTNHPQGEPGSSQKLPSFAIFLSLSTPDENRPVAKEELLSPTTIGDPVSSAVRTSNQSRYPEVPSPTSAGDKFRNWFPETRFDREFGTAVIDPWSKKVSSGALSMDPNRPKPRSALLESQTDQGCPSRRTSLPSISALTSQESHDAEHHHNLWRRASTNTTLAGNRLVSLHNSQVPAMFPAARDLGLPPVRVPCLTGSRALPTRLGPSGREALANAPSSPPPSPMTPGIQRRSSADSVSTLGSLPSSSLAASARKAGSQNNGEEGASSRSGSGRQMYKCPFEGCEQLYTWKENLTRHHTTRCPFCKVNAERPSFNRIDNFKEHIRRHMNERDNGRTRTEYHPGAADFYRQLMEETRGDRRRGKGRGRRTSSRSDMSDDSGSASGG